MIELKNKTWSEERALYHQSNAHLIDCRFEGEEDGESACKEASHLVVENSYFDLRYPFWHCHHLKLTQIEMTERCRAALWYSKNILIQNSKLQGIKALRECRQIELLNCDIQSPEFGWRSVAIRGKNVSLQSEYAFFEARKVQFQGLSLTGKYTFQYAKEIEMDQCQLQTKDAFWHAKHVTIRDSVIRGEYIGWYSDQCTLIRCRIIGTQPFCYCTRLTLIDCTLEEADLAFEYSDVEASLNGTLVSIKNPRSGRIEVDEMPTCIYTNDAVYPSTTKIEVRSKGNQNEPKEKQI